MADACPDCRDQLDPVLSGLRARTGVTAAQWLWAPAAGSADHALVAPDRRVVLHAERGTSTLLRGISTSLPLRDKSVGTLVVPLLLPVQEDVDGLFAELRRVLRSHGLLTMLVPAHPSFGFRGRRLRAEMRARWRHRSAVDHPDWLAAAADFAVMGDDRVEFAADGDEDPSVLVDRFCAGGVYPPGMPVGLRDQVAAHLAARPGPVRVPLRRLVTRR